jgi:hypothetical protein
MLVWRHWVNPLIRRTATDYDCNDGWANLVADVLLAFQPAQANLQGFVPLLLCEGVVWA